MIGILSMIWNREGMDEGGPMRGGAAGVGCRCVVSQYTYSCWCLALRAVVCGR